MRSSILEAVYAHDLPALRALLKNREPARNRETLLGFQEALGDNLADVVEVFLEEGIDLNGVEATGFTALISAVRGGQIPMVNRLLAAGAYVNGPDAHGATPLHYAAMRQSLDLVQLLVEAGANPNSRDCQGNTPLDLAYRREIQLPAALPLIGASIITYANRKDTPLVAYLRELSHSSPDSGRDDAE